MRRSPRSLAAVAALAALALTGCQASDPGAAGGSSAATSAGASQLESIKKAGTIVFASDTTYAPAEFIGEDGKPTGYDVEIAQGIAAKMGLKAEVTTASFDSILGGIGTKYAAGISSFTITPERAQQVNFVKYFQAGIGYAVAAGNPKNIDAANLCGVKMAVQTGTIEDDMSAEASKACTDAGKPAIDIKRYPAQADATTNLVGGNVDIMFADSPIIGYAVAQTAGKLEQLGESTDVSAQGIALPKDDAELSQAVQTALQEMIDDGSYGKILEKWGVAEGAVTTADLNPTS
ncbi:ABC transporter substrate-binding protein [Micrococcales bacterium 31B]|nr:ABC transporter substrate-binding protein [Micrococcales bacterium 31B]